MKPPGKVDDKDEVLRVNVKVGLCRLRVFSSEKLMKRQTWFKLAQNYGGPSFAHGLYGSY